MESNVYIEQMYRGFIVADYSEGNDVAPSYGACYHGPRRQTGQPMFQPDEVFPTRAAAKEYAAKLRARIEGLPTPPPGETEGG